MTDVKTMLALDDALERGEKNEISPRMMRLSYTDCAHLAAILLHEREYHFKQCGATATPVIDSLIRKLHETFPEQNWIRFVQ